MALTNDEATFVEGVSRQTGIDPRVLVAWIRSEGHPGDTAHNYMNITSTTAAYLGEPTSGTLAAGTAAFPDVQTGIDATVKEIRSLGLTHEQRKTPGQAIADIAASPWASSHYGGAGGPNLRATFESIFGKGSASSPYEGPEWAATVASTATTGSAADATSVDLGSAAHAAGHAASKLLAPFTLGERVFRFLTSWRFAEVVGGFLLLVLGLALLGKQFGVNVPGPVGAAAGSVSPPEFLGPPGSGSEAHYRSSRARTGGPAKREDLSPRPKAVYSGRDDIPF